MNSVQSAPPDSPTNISVRYILGEVIGQGGMGVVYVAHDRLTDQAVALKQVLARFTSTRPGSDTTPNPGITLPDTNNSLTLQPTEAGNRHGLILAHEFKVLASLRHPNIISVLDYGFDQEQHPFFTMDLLEKPKTLLEFGQSCSTSGKVELLQQLFQALAYLHRHGILHRDIKPGNVMVAANRLKVLDFGLSLAGEASRGISGTILYMPPEVLQGEPFSEAGDLYAVGVMAYELFAGLHPFKSHNNADTMQRILNQIPNVAALAIDPRLKSLIELLLTKKSADRTLSAVEAIAICNACTGQNMLGETTAIRESFIQSASFIGREDALAALSQALAKVQHNSGGLWLIGGESGVGKTRLFDEVRALALVQGLLVLRGQAISDGATPYQLWRSVLREIILYISPTDLEAATLKPLIPDIERLIGRTVQNAPSDDPQTIRVRLHGVIADIILRLPQGTLILLEDLHWAGEESLTLLKALARVYNTKSLLILSSYRNDDRSDLPLLFSGAQHLTLERLSKQETAQLGQAMLGAAGANHELVSLLQRETEGNPFFLVEVMRALAEDAGDLDRIGTQALPAHVLTGGIQQLVTRRLNRVPSSLQPLLRIAATAGRQLDLPLIRAARDITGGPEVERLLSFCTEVAILEVQNQQWLFTHDKIREDLLALSGADEQRLLHATVARAIETAYPDDPRQIRSLAYHWAAAGEPAKERQYAAKAAAQSLATGAYQNALTYAQRALALLLVEPTGASWADQEQSNNDRANLERTLGVIYNGLGNTDQAIIHLVEALRLLGYPMPVAGTTLAGGLALQLLRQLSHLLLRKRPNRPGIQQTARTVALLYEQLALAYYWQGQKMPATFAALATLNNSETAGTSPGLARAYANMSVAAGLVPVHWLAGNYAKRAFSTAQKVSDTLSLAAVTRIALAYTVGNGDWATVEQQSNRALEIAQANVDYRVWGDTLAHAQGIAWYQGKFDRAAYFAKVLQQVAERSENRQFTGWALTYAGQVAMVHGDLEEALIPLQTASQIIDAANDKVLCCICYGSLGLLALWRSASDEALQIFTEKAHLFNNRVALNYGITQAFADRAEVFAELLRQDPGSSVLLKLLRDSGQAQGHAAKLFRISRPRAALTYGILNHLDGNHLNARRHWQRALQEAQALQMRHEEGMILLTIGRYENQLETIGQARHIFSEIGARYRVLLCDDLLTP